MTYRTVRAWKQNENAVDVVVFNVVSMMACAERGARLITDARFSVGSTSACVTPLLNPRSRSAHSYPPHCMAHVERCIDVHLYDRTSTPQSPLHRFANSRLRLSPRARVFPRISFSLSLSLSFFLAHRVRRRKGRRAFGKQNPRSVSALSGDVRR